MVLVKLQREISNREMDKALIIGLKAIPPGYDIKGCHGEGQAGTEILPDPMGYLFQMPYLSEHGEDCLHQHALIPLTTTAESKIRWVTYLGMETHVCKHYHSIHKPGCQRLEMSIMNIGCSTVPGCYETQMVKHHTELASYNPAVIGLPLFAYLGETTAFSCWMEQLNAIAVYDTQHRGRCQKAITPVLVNSEQAKETGTVWQSRKHVLMVACEPAIESPVAHPFDG